MNFRKLLPYILPPLALLLGGLYCYLSVFQPGCPYLRLGGNKCQYSRLFSAEGLLVEESFFNTNVTVVPQHSFANNKAAEGVFVEIWLNGNQFGSHEIERWATSAVAAEQYRTTTEVSGIAVFPCGIKPNIYFESRIADNFCAACSTGGHCRSVAQYEDYISVIKLDIGSRFTEADFIDLLNQIDQRMIEYLR
jgi:hypothetical protein